MLPGVAKMIVLFAISTLSEPLSILIAAPVKKPN
jgi:hypothetical protein